jgi:hypothetical protein
MVRARPPRPVTPATDLHRTPDGAKRTMRGRENLPCRLRNPPSPLSPSRTSPYGEAARPRRRPAPWPPAAPGGAAWRASQDGRFAAASGCAGTGPGSLRAGPGSRWRCTGSARHPATGPPERRPGAGSRGLAVRTRSGGRPGPRAPGSTGPRSVPRRRETGGSCGCGPALRPARAWRGWRPRASGSRPALQPVRAPAPRESPNRWWAGSGPAPAGRRFSGRRGGRCGVRAPRWGCGAPPETGQTR